MYSLSLGLGRPLFQRPQRQGQVLEQQIKLFYCQTKFTAKTLKVLVKVLKIAKDQYFSHFPSGFAMKRSKLDP